MKYSVALCFVSIATLGLASNEVVPPAVGLHLKNPSSTLSQVVPTTNEKENFKEVSSKTSSDDHAPKLSDADEKHKNLVLEHKQYLHQKHMFVRRQTKQVLQHHHDALNMQKMGHNGHTHEREFHTQNLLIIPFGTHVNADKHMQHPFHERFLSHDALKGLQSCQQSNMNNNGGQPVGHKKRRLMTSKAAHKCRTPYETCIANSLEPHYKTMKDRIKDPIDEVVIHRAAKHCDHLSSVDKRLLAAHRENFLSHHDGQSDHGKKSQMPIRNPQVYHGLVPHSDFIQPFLNKMFPADDYTSSEMRHCMQHKLTHKEWHDEHGASNPHSFRLAEIHCHHDLHGFYDRQHAFQSVEATHGTGLRPPPHTAPPIHLSATHKRYQQDVSRRRRMSEL